MPPLQSLQFCPEGANRARYDMPGCSVRNAVFSQNVILRVALRGYLPGAPTDAEGKMAPLQDRRWQQQIPTPLSSLLSSKGFKLCTPFRQSDWRWSGAGSHLGEVIQSGGTTEQFEQAAASFSWCS